MRRLLANTFFSLLLFLLCFTAQTVVGQDDFNAVDLNQIRQRKIRKLIRQLQASDNTGFSDLETSVNSKTPMDDYLHYVKEYEVKQDIEEVWYNYAFASQTEVWDISKISFGMIYCRDSKSIIYADQMLNGISEGRIYYLNLKMLNGIYNLPVAFEITSIDPDKKMVEFTYLKGGKARGKQWIHLEATPEGSTKIIHQTMVKSDSNFRDKYIYPYFHNKLINEFHVNMKRIITARSKRRIDILAFENDQQLNHGPSD